MRRAAGVGALPTILRRSSGTARRWACATFHGLDHRRPHTNIFVLRPNGRSLLRRFAIRSDAVADALGKSASVSPVAIDSSTADRLGCIPAAGPSPRAARPLPLQWSRHPGPVPGQGPASLAAHGNGDRLAVVRQHLLASRHRRDFAMAVLVKSIILSAVQQGHELEGLGEAAGSLSNMIPPW